jgi:histidine ammonia-lyase
VNVTSWDEEITGSRFNEARRRTKVLNLPRIGRGGNQYGISAGFGRTMHIRQQHNSITHWDRNVVILCHGVGRLRHIAIFTASGLWAVESTLTGVNPGRWNVIHPFLL